MTQPSTSTTTRPARAARIGFWIIAAFGPVAAVLAWSWYGLAQYEAQSEQGKAVAAGTTMAGFAEVMGGIPLMLAHLVGLAALLPLGWKGYRERGIVFAIASFLVASAIGLVVAQFLWSGDLFQLGIDNDTYVP